MVSYEVSFFHNPIQHLWIQFPENMELRGIPLRDMIGFSRKEKNLSKTERRYQDVLYRNGLPYSKFGVCGSE